MRIKKMIASFLAAVMFQSGVMVVSAEENTSASFVYDDFSVNYEIKNSYGDTDVVDVTLTNTGEETIEDWMLYFDPNGEIQYVDNVDKTTTSSSSTTTPTTTTTVTTTVTTEADTEQTTDAGGSVTTETSTVPPTTTTGTETTLPQTGYSKWYQVLIAAAMGMIGVGSTAIVKSGIFRKKENNS